METILHVIEQIKKHWNFCLPQIDEALVWLHCATVFLAQFVLKVVLSYTLFHLSLLKLRENALD